MQHLRISWYFLGFRLHVFLADWDYKAEVPGKLSSQENEVGKKKKKELKEHEKLPALVEPVRQQSLFSDYGKTSEMMTRVC